MKAFFDKTRKRVHTWLMEHAESPTGMRWLAFISFIEATFFILPVDLMIVAYVSVKNRRWLRTGIVAGIFSTLGGAAGYAIGFWFFDFVGQPIISFYHLEDEMLKLGTSFANNDFLTIITAAFTPMPYKLFVIGAGFFKINFWVFLIASAVGRTLRYIIVSYLSKLYGYKVARFIYRYFDIMAVIGVLVLVVGIYLILS